jgi:hypothetical protein
MLEQLTNPEARKAIELVVENYERLVKITGATERSSELASDPKPSNLATPDARRVRSRITSSRRHAP